MTKREFDRLRAGDFVTNKEDEIFKIDMDYVFGLPTQVFSAVLQREGKYHSIRVNKGNFQFYEIIFP